MAKGTTTERGYGWTHQQARAAALRHLVDGQRCSRCYQPMYRAQAQHLDLDHTDDRSAYRGLAHRSCNRRAGQAKATRRRAPQQSAARPVDRQPTRRSRNW